MARFRNPRYAPESLERRLSPSGLGMPVPSAEVAMFLATEDPSDQLGATQDPGGTVVPVSPIQTPEIPPDQVPPDPSETPLELPPPPTIVILPG